MQSFWHRRFSTSSQSTRYKKSQSTRHQRTEGGYQATWIGMYRHLMEKPVGSYQSQDWMQAKKMLNSYQDHSRELGAPYMIEHGFTLLNRLLEEIQQTTYIAQTKMHHPPMRSLPKKQPWKINISMVPMDATHLGALLVAWRDLLFLNKEEAAARSHDDILSWTEVLSIVEKCMDAQLFRAEIVPFNIILHVMGSLVQFARNPEGIVREGEALVDRLVEKAHRNHENAPFHPNSLCILGMVELLAKSKTRNSGAKAEKYMELLQSSQKERHFDPRFKLRPSIYCSVMEAHAGTSDPSIAIQRIPALIQEMKSTFRSTNISLKHWNRVCHALSLVRHEQSADLARDIWDELVQTESFAPPDAITVIACLSAYDRAGRVTELQDFYYEIEGHIAQNHPRYQALADIQSNSKVQSALAWAHARAGNHGKAEEILMHHLKNKKGTSRESLKFWNAVLVSWAAHGDDASAERIKSVIDHFSENDGIVDIRLYNTLLTCYKNYGNEEGAKLAETLLAWLESQSDPKLQPTVASHMNVVSAWAQAGKPQESYRALSRLSEKALESGRHAEDLHVGMFGIVVDAFSQKGMAEQAETVLDLMSKFRHLQPNAFIYSSLIWAWTRNQQETDPNVPVSLLYQDMLSSYNAGNVSIKPNGYIFSGILTALSLSPDRSAIEKAQFILDEMDRFQVKATSHHQVGLMKLWAKWERPDRVEEIFASVRENHKAGTQLHYQLYNVRLQAWSLVRDPTKAAEVLREWIADHREELVAEKPTAGAFGTVLRAWFHSQRPEAPHKIEEGLEGMIRLADAEEFDCRPRFVEYTTVVLAWMQSADSERETKVQHFLLRLREAAVREVAEGLDEMQTKRCLECLDEIETLGREKAMEDSESFDKTVESIRSEFLSQNGDQ